MFKGKTSEIYDYEIRRRIAPLNAVFLAKLASFDNNHKKAGEIYQKEPNNILILEYMLNCQFNLLKLKMQK